MNKNLSQVPDNISPGMGSNRKNSQRGCSILTSSNHSRNPKQNDIFLVQC